ncbi:hypothetical protein PGQ11_009245 [Apiospora arundinis]|uniref:Uncharacterized protein n=1 Tax=Apiospora arundinis TaxID=335852 RepID=A0ABR2II05_9PEZI
MEWLSQDEHFVEADLRRFKFETSSPFLVQTVKININQKDETDFSLEEMKSEEEYRSWTDSCQSLIDGKVPTVLLAMHKRLPEEKATAIPYGKKALQNACERLFQHRSLALTMPRTSHAVFSRHSVEWSDQRSLGPSIVYNCRSDTTCNTGKEDDILMSVTSFPDIPLTIVVMYGCTDTTMDFVSQYLDTFRRSALHPLMMPMMFVELERKRLLEVLRMETTNLNQRVLDMETRLRSSTQQSTMSEKVGITDKKADTPDDNMLRKDCKAAQLWLKVSELKNGVQGLITVLESICTHSREFLPESNPGAGQDADKRQIYVHKTEKFRERLGEMMLELRSEVRTCDGVLGGMSLATQMEWNYHTRRDAKANIIIAHASKKDSSQMRYISFLGMVFLPGTFLATLFSMSFFNWIPDESPQVISPWIGLYCGSAAILTLLTYWRYRQYTAIQAVIIDKNMQKAMESDSDSIV